MNEKQKPLQDKDRTYDGIDSPFRAFSRAMYGDEAVDRMATSRYRAARIAYAKHVLTEFALWCATVVCAMATATTLVALGWVFSMIIGLWLV